MSPGAQPASEGRMQQMRDGRSLQGSSRESHGLSLFGDQTNQSPLSRTSMNASFKQDLIFTRRWEARSNPPRYEPSARLSLDNKLTAASCTMRVRCQTTIRLESGFICLWWWPKRISRSNCVAVGDASLERRCRAIRDYEHWRLEDRQYLPRPCIVGPNALRDPVDKIETARRETFSTTKKQNSSASATCFIE